MPEPGKFNYEYHAVAKAFNEWMRRYIECPDQFAREWEAVGEFLKEQHKGDAPYYGLQCAAYLEKLLNA